MTFPETNNSLHNISSSDAFAYGDHSGEGIKVGVPGVILGEIPFDPTQHDPSAINPLSINGLLFDRPYVNEVKPSRSLEMNVVADYRSIPGEHPGIAIAKVRAFDQINMALSDAVSSATDRYNVYTIGASRPTVFDLDAEELVGVEASDKVAEQAVAEICMSGLTIVVSDFSRLKFNSHADMARSGYSSNSSRNSGYGFERAIAVKTNHKLELQLPANTGRLAIGGLKEVNTSKSRELTSANEALTAKHFSIVDNLEVQGFEVAGAVISADAGSIGFNARTVDESISRAIDRVEEKSY